MVGRLMVCEPYLLYNARCKLISGHGRPEEASTHYLGFLVAHVNWIAGPCTDLTGDLFGTKNHQHSWYGELLLF